tara:strand:- start:149 stop:493 length:345 start_codon:yes stop_codon:yes gene_type:complete
LKNEYELESIVYKNEKKKLYLQFKDGLKSSLSTELLRVESPSAEVQGHSKLQKKIVLNKNNVAIKKIERVGNYAVKIHFDDGHNTGIYSWKLLRSMAQNSDEIIRNYYNKLKKI